MTDIVYNKNGIPFDIDALATDVNGKADRDLLNLSNTGQAIIDNKMDRDLSNASDTALKEFYFMPGETYSFNMGDSAPITFGVLTSSQKNIILGFVLPKRLDKITSITVNTLRTNLRQVGGGYIPNSSYTSGGEDLLNKGTVSVSFFPYSNNIRITIVLSTASSVTNNTPICGEIHQLSLTFQ